VSGLHLLCGSEGLQWCRAGCCSKTMATRQRLSGRAGAGTEALRLIALFLLFPAVFPSPLTVPLSLGCLAPSPEGRGLYMWHLSHSWSTSTPVPLVPSPKTPRSQLASCCTPGFLSTLCCLGSHPGCPHRVRVRLGIDAGGAAQLYAAPGGQGEPQVTLSGGHSPPGGV